MAKALFTGLKPFGELVPFDITIAPGVGQFTIPPPPPVALSVVPLIDRFVPRVIACTCPKPLVPSIGALG